MAFGAVLLALGLIYVAAWRTLPAGAERAGPPASRAAASQLVAVTSDVRVCPPPGRDSGPGRIAMIAMPSGATKGSAVLTPVPQSSPTTAAAGKGRSARNSQTQPPSLSISRPGAMSLLTAPGTDAAVVTAAGAMAQGLEAEQAGTSGMSAIACGRPGSDMWFVGTGQQDGAADIQLYLMNAGSLAASVDVTIVTDSGVVQGSLATGITVPPRQFVVQSIAPFVHGSAVLALHVQTTSGQVAASVWEGPARGTGGAWLPMAADPATRLVIPGLTAASGAARLLVVVPGNTDAQLKVTALTPQGNYLPFGSSAVDAPAAAASSFTLSSLGGAAAGIELSSSVPVNAAVLVPGNGIGAFTTATGPVAEQGIVAGNPVGSGFTTGLLLSAPGGTVQARVTAIEGTAGPSAAAATTTTQVVTVKAGHTIAVAIRPPRGTRTAFATVITPLAGSGPLYAARLVTEGGGGLSGTVASIMPVPSAPTAVDLPQVRDAYTAIMP